MKRSDYVPGLRVSLVSEQSSIPMVECSDAKMTAKLVCSIIPKGDEREYFMAILMNVRNQVKGVSVVGIGTLTASLVHPREVFRAAIVAGAASVIVAHNHPSGICYPSPEDRMTTRRLKKAGEIIGIPLLDHVIVTTNEDEYYSFRNDGMLS